jgi:integrase
MSPSRRPRISARRSTVRIATGTIALAFKLDVERRRQAGILFQAPPESFGEVAHAWLERFVIGAAGRVRPRPKTIRTAEDCLRYLAPLNELALERVRRPHVEDLLASVATHAPRRAEMVLSLLKRILKAAEERGQQVDRAIYGIRIAKADEREPRFLTWEEAEELQSWMPEYVCRMRRAGRPSRAGSGGSLRARRR